MQKTTLALLLVFLLAGLIVSCGTGGNSAINRADMDLSVSPGNNLFRYANGAWIDRAEIPDDKTAYTSFNLLREKKDKNVHALLEGLAAASNREAGSIAQKISDFYFTGMDVDAVNKDGFASLQPQIDQINNISDLADLQSVIGDFHKYGLDPLFGGAVFEDLMNNEIYKFYFAQAGTGLPDVEYYYKEDDRSKEIRTEYKKHVAKMFELLGDDSEKAEQNAATIMEIETRLAKKSKTRVEMRNIPALYNRMTMKELQELAPNFDWQKYLKNLSDTDFGDVIVMSPKFFKEVSNILFDFSLNDWKAYLRWNLINHSAAFLSEDFVNQDFNFFSEFLSGSKKIKDRWKRVTRTVNDLVGEPLGQLYVKKYFPEESKKKMVEMVGFLKKSMAQRLENLDWMGSETKKEAKIKLDKMRFKIGYPDKWKDFSNLEIKRDAYILNVRRANYFHFYQQLNKFGKPVDKEEWGMSPQTVNAGYNPIQNEMTFPAGILQPPFFDVAADDAVNYGAIGMVIGHEMTHGFDDQGRRFDSNGNMRDWWTKEDAAEFNKRTRLLIDQYNRFIAIDDVHVNGELTLGENLADFGGLTLSILAYKMSIKNGPAAEVIDGFTPEQRYFLGFARVWRGKIRDKALKRKCQEDVHPWGEFRVNGAPFNVPELYEAFEINPDDALYIKPEMRPVIW